MASYNEVIGIILDTCKDINLIYSEEGDGRITSAVKEEEYLTLLKEGILNRKPSYKVEIPPPRHWYDIRINDIPINLKLTSGGTDNVFNKTAIIFTITGKEPKKHSMNFNSFLNMIREGQKKEMRVQATEYHYLVVHKRTGSVILKPILDIHTFKSNPSNDLQINWNNEFKHSGYRIDDEKFRDKICELLKTIQTSIQKALSGSREFADIDLTTVCYEE